MQTWNPPVFVQISSGVGTHPITFVWVPYYQGTSTFWVLEQR